MTIPLPPLPPMAVNGRLSLSPVEVRAIQREAMRVALEAAARVCEYSAEGCTWMTQHILQSNADAIRNLEIGT